MTQSLKPPSGPTEPPHTDERAPLLSADVEALASPGGGGYDGYNDNADADADEASFQSTKSVWYLTLLTLSIGGLQIAWSVELSNGSPYLLSLGLSKSLMALVWIAGPLSGTLVQPYVGMRSDRCRVPWGKRKPFMVGGAVATMVALMGLAWTRETVAGTLSWVFGVDPAAEGVRVAVIAVAVGWVYVLDFAINTVQAAIRAFIVDCCPAHQQEAVNAMASRMTGIGNIIGYVAGYANLPSFLWWLGRTQFQDLCAIACVALGSTIAISCVLVRERDPRREGPPAASDKQGVVAFFREIAQAMRRLPPQIQKVCLVQFCAWVGFFPMLFYTSSYVGEIYVAPILEAHPHMTPAELDRLYEEATRVGTFALLVYAITSLCTNVFLPFFIAPTYDRAADGATAVRSSWLDYLVIPGLTLRRAWMLSLLLFSGSMFCTVLVTSVAAATTLIGLVGITWALTLWAPWAIISAEISRRDAQRRQAGSNSADKADQAGVILGIHNMAIAAPQILATVGSSIVFKFLQKPRGTPGDHSISVVMALGGVTVLLAAYYVHRIEDEPAALMADGVLCGEADSDGDAVFADGDDVDDHSANGHARSLSSEQLTRASLDRATLARRSSFGGGLEY